jgi:protein-S-isoprenylcysteine O-methyltransferase Ste14
MSRFKAGIPLLMGLVLTPLVLYSAWYTLSGLPTGMHAMAWVLLSIYVGWILVEGRITAGEISKQGRTDDRWSCELYALSRAFTVLCAVSLPGLWTQFNAVNIAGVLLFAAGIVFRLQAIRTLGQFYSHRVRLQDDHQIITSGPYKVVRHPAYAGMLAANLGFVLYFCNLWALAAFLFLFVPAIVWRIRIEEQNMHLISGYEGYAQSHKRLVPLLW